MKKSELKSLIRETIEEMHFSSLHEEKNQDVTDLVNKLRSSIDGEFKNPTINIAAKRTLLMVMTELVKGGWHPSQDIK